ncbi:MAG: formate dehydrogenase accessory sulfurtransferase FdhD [Blautia sp.]|nr:formate dehydrogenase accessory sulfurtransferase FdhD [Blautia sp.]
MKRNDNDHQIDIFCPVKIIRIYPDGERTEEEDLVITEHPLRLVFGHRHLAEIVCTPRELRELVTGHLFTEGLIRSVEDIKELTINEDGTVAEVMPERDSMEPLLTNPLPSHSFTAEDIFSAIEHFSAGSSIHNRTWGTHRCMLVGKQGEILVSCEDISRHNALDKAIGSALIQRLPLGDLAMFTSGRVPLDMMSKVIFAGIPLLISKSVPTVQAIELAERYGMTLITSAWPDNFRLVTGYIRRDKPGSGTGGFS